MVEEVRLGMVGMEIIDLMALRALMGLCVGKQS